MLGCINGTPEGLPEAARHPPSAQRLSQRLTLRLSTWFCRCHCRSTSGNTSAGFLTLDDVYADALCLAIRGFVESDACLLASCLRSSGEALRRSQLIYYHSAHCLDASSRKYGRSLL